MGGDNSVIPLNTLVKYLKSASGRDKVNRLIVYFSKYVLWQMEASGSDKDTISRLKYTSNQIGSARKLMRIGRPLEYVQAIAESGSIEDLILRVLTIIKSSGLALWLWYDMKGWLHTAKVITLPDPKYNKRRGDRFWIVGLTASLIAVMYQLNKTNRSIRKAKKSDDTNRNNKLSELRKKRAKFMKALVKTSIDWFIPAARLDILPIPDGVVGLLGTVTSIIGIQEEWKNASK